MLLVARACVVWSVRNGIRLRASAVANDDGVAEWEEDARQVEFMANMNRTRQINEEVGGLEIALVQRGTQDPDAVSHTSSISSGEIEGSDATCTAFNRQPEQEATSYIPIPSQSSI